MAKTSERALGSGDLSEGVWIVAMGAKKTTVCTSASQALGEAPASSNVSVRRVDGDP